MKKWICGGLLILLIMAVAVAGFIYNSNISDNQDMPESLVVVSPHPTEFIIPLIQEFEGEIGINVEIISCGTTEAIESITNDSNIDVLWGGSLLSVGPYKDSFYPYVSLNRAVYKSVFS